MKRSQTRHIRWNYSAVLLCGRRAPLGRRIHRSWPLCKTCERIAARKGGVRWSVWDADGWQDTPHVLTSANAANVSVTWVKP